MFDSTVPIRNQAITCGNWEGLWEESLENLRSEGNGLDQSSEEVPGPNEISAYLISEGLRSGKPPFASQRLEE